MAATGWYPDPSGQPGRYRYWDGSRWSAETTDDPTRPYAPGASTSDGRERRRLALVAVVALVLVAMLIVTIAVLVRRETNRAEDSPPVSTTSSWDDSSAGVRSPTTGGPTAGTTAQSKPSSVPPPSPTGTPRPDGTGLAPPTTRPHNAPRSQCPAERMDTWSKQPDPTRIRGGDLSIPRLGPPWNAVIDDQYAMSLGWARDIGGLSETIDYGDNATLFVGAVRPPAKHPDESVKQSALRLSRCVVQDYLDQELVVTGVRHLQSESIMVDGHHGWLVRTQSAIDDLQHGADGLLSDVVVVDTGKRLSFFFGEIPYPDPGRIATMDAMVEALRVE